MKPLYAAALTLALGACAAGPGELPNASDVTLPQAFTFADNASAEADVADLLPEDPAFDALARSALARSPTLGAALARIDIARAGAARAGAERMPAIGYDAGLGAARTNPDQFGADLPPGAAFDTERVSYSANLTARWDPDLFGALRASERAAAARLDAASADAAAVRLALVAEIGGAVIDWRTLAAREAALAADLESAAAIARLAGVRENAGIAPGADRIRAQAQAAASRSRIAALASERARIIGRLVALTALPADDIRAALAVDAEQSALSPAPAALPSTLLTARPDIVAASYRLMAADAEVAVAAARRFPRLDLSAGIGLLAFALGDIFDADSVIGNAAAGVAGPLLDFGRIEAAIDAAEGQTLQAFQQYRDAVFTALGDAESAYALIATADAQAAAAHDEAAMAARAATLAETRYRAGLDNFLSALEARRAADASGDRAAAARGRAQRARLLLWQALGGSALD